MMEKNKNFSKMFSLRNNLRTDILGDKMSYIINQKDYSQSSKNRESFLDYINIENKNTNRSRNNFMTIEIQNEEEANSDEYISSTMLDVETNTYIEPIEKKSNLVSGKHYKMNSLQLKKRMLKCEENNKNLLINCLFSNKFNHKKKTYSVK